MGNREREREAKKEMSLFSREKNIEHLSLSRERKTKSRFN